ncbi:MAG: serine/threonine-protein phosphatase [Pseudomonadales bacterium]|nr:serine/threonine-protein phosphatase [Pseudomonadales bacterium]
MTEYTVLMQQFTEKIYIDSQMAACDSPVQNVAVFSTRAPYRQDESANEDAAAVVAIDEHSSLLIVADGVGGTPGGADAAALTIKTVLKNIKGGNTGEMRETILSAIEQANQALLDKGSGSATTLVLVEVNSTTVRPYHVGDSVAMMTGQRGKLKLETLSHSPVGYAVEAGVLSEDEGFHHEDRHIVSNIVGMPDMHVTMGMPVTMATFDTLLLGTDGLFDNLQRDEIVEIIRHGDLRQSANDLATRALARMTDAQAEGKPDDLTFILFRRSRK